MLSALMLAQWNEIFKAHNIVLGEEGGENAPILVDIT